MTLSITQTLGGLAGSAVLGTFQLHREQLYSSALTSQLDHPARIIDLKVMETWLQGERRYAA